MKLGFIGLGIMGAPMAGHLVKAGHTLFVQVRHSMPATLAGQVTACSSGADVARQADVIFTMVPDTPDVEAVLFGENGEPTVSYEIDAGDDQITATVTVPSRRPPGSLKLRLRLPLSEQILAVRVDGKPRPFDRNTSTIDLSGLHGTLYVDAVLGK